MESSDNEKNLISFVDFPFICRICFVRSELRLFEEEKNLWDLFQYLMKNEVHPTTDSPKNVCSDCINKLRDISLLIEVSRYTASYFQNNVFSTEVEDGPQPKPEKPDQDNEMPRYCSSCLSTTHLSLFKGKISLLQLYQEITGINVTTSTNMNSICYRCINELEKASSFLNLSKKNIGILEILATVDVKKEVLNTDDDERIIERSEVKDEIHDEHAIASNGTKILDNCMYNRNSESFVVKNEFQQLHTAFDIKDEVLENDHIVIDGSIDTKQFRCNHCDKRFSQKRHLQSHLLNHTGEKPFPCEYCDKRFAHKGYVRTHLRTHTGEKPFQCDYCDRRFTQKCSLRTHILTHTGEKPFKCDYCDKRFTLKCHLQSHMHTHTGEKPYKCDHCDKRFTHYTTLRHHLLTHTGEKPFKCEYCDKRFARKDILRYHLRTHTGEKPYKCDHCDKRFTQEIILRTHLLTHTGEKPFKCDYCHKKFAHKSTLQYHLLTHTGEKPFGCYHCDKRFTTKVNLRSHLLTHNAPQ